MTPSCKARQKYLKDSKTGLILSERGVGTEGAICRAWAQEFIHNGKFIMFSYFLRERICALGYVVPVICGAIYVLVFNGYYSGISEDLYIARDDGVITLSHAKNLVDYGVVGVGPSGEKVEGYSAPLQFIVFSLLYLFVDISYISYANLQTILCSFLLGFIWGCIFEEKKLYALMSSVVVAYAYTQHSSFLEWHGSGMENSITHVMFAYTVYILFVFTRTRTIYYPLAIVPFLAAITRIDSIYHVMPVLLVFSVCWYLFENNLKAFRFILVVMLLWLTFHLIRYFYFGDIFPNTAYAQGISLSDRVAGLISLNVKFFSDSIDLSRQLASSHGAYYLLLVLPLLIFAKFKQEWEFLLLASLSLILTGLLNPFFFGPTRLDVTRSTTQIVFFVYLAIAIVVLFTPKKVITLFLPLCIPLYFLINSINFVPAYNLCCGTRGFNETGRVFEELAEKEDLYRPTVANPDLGAISWRKRFNIVDLGMLGSVVMARVKDPILRADYFLHYSEPDFIESHQWWLCGNNKGIFSSSEFENKYKSVKASDGFFEPCGPKSVVSGIWVRKDIEKASASPERRLIDDLMKSLTIARIEAEMSACLSKEGNMAYKCSYIARTVYRFIPELKQNGIYLQLVELFRSYGANPFDMFLLTAYYDAYAVNGAIKYIFDNYILEHGMQVKGKFNGFDIYFQGSTLAVFSGRCRNKNSLAPFYLHVTPDLAIDNARSENGFINIDFNLRNDGFVTGDMCGAVRELPPKMNYRNIVIGQWLPVKERALWEMDLAASN